jgi:cytochrome c-type biogenesis protein CcmE
MNQKQKFRLFSILAILLALGLAIALVLYALNQNINLFYTPSQLVNESIGPDQTIRLGGFVKKGSIVFLENGASVNFIITDHKRSIAISYQGILPGLFREDQGIVVTGTQVLAKHDEKYMPSSYFKNKKWENKN